MAELNYQRDVEIDLSRLDREWVRQPKLALNYAEAASRARAEADRAKEHLSVVKAEVEADIRRGFDARGEKKPPETAFPSLVAQDKRVRAAEAENIDAWEAYGLVMAGKDAVCEQKRSALENLVRLYGQQYFSAPRATEEDAEAAIGAQRQEADRKLAKAVTAERGRGHRAAPVGGRR